MTAEEHLEAALKELETGEPEDSASRDEIEMHIREALVAVSTARFSWVGDREAPDALWYRHVPTNCRPEPL
jgi:hypothetical protein